MDSVVTAHLAQHLFTRERLELILAQLAGRGGPSREKRLAEVTSLRKKLREADRAQENLLAVVEKQGLLCDGVVMERISKLQQEREGLVRLISGAERELNAPAPDLSPAKLAAFANAVRQKLQSGPVEFRKQYPRLFVDCIEVSDSEARILGSKEVLARALASGGNGAAGTVPSFVQNWRAVEDEGENRWSVRLKT